LDRISRWPRRAAGQLALAALAAAPAGAEDAEANEVARVAGVAAAFAIEIDASLSRQRSSGWGTTVDVYPTLALSGDLAGGWTADLLMAPEFYLTTAPDTLAGFAVDDPYGLVSASLTSPDGVILGIELSATFDFGGNDLLIDESRFGFLESDRFGRLAFGTLGSAMTEYCIEAPGGSTNFDPDDLLGFGTCEGLSEQGTVLYASPAFGPGYSVALSYSSSGDGQLDPGLASRSASAALLFAGAAGAVELEASLGVERVFDISGDGYNGVGDLLAYQAGFAAVDGDWTWGASAQAFDLDEPGVDIQSVQFGAAWTASEALTLSVGAGYARLRAETDGSDIGRRGTERSAGATAEYVVIPDLLAVDVGLAFIRRDFDTRNDLQVGLGLRLTR
jgi:hypothetical protein